MTSELDLAQYSNTPALHYSEEASTLRTGSRKAFVPEGPNDSSLAVYCQECVRIAIRPVGYGVIRAEGTF